MHQDNLRVALNPYQKPATYMRPSRAVCSAQPLLKEQTSPWPARTFLRLLCGANLLLSTALNRSSHLRPRASMPRFGMRIDWGFSIESRARVQSSAFVFRFRQLFPFTSSCHCRACARLPAAWVSYALPKLSTLCYAHAAPRQPEQLLDYTLTYAYIGRLAILHISTLRFFVHGKKKEKDVAIFRFLA
jgi:hypothetical protein